MDRRTVGAVKVLLATAVALSALLVPSPAHAVDRRPCVSSAEFNSLPSYIRNHGHRPTRAELEAHWETKGVPGELGILGEGFIYKRCGYTMREHWYGVAFTHGTVRAVTWGPIG